MADKRLTKGEATRIEIMGVAHELFLKQGYHGTSIRQIAGAAGITLGAIYNHFSSKEEIFRAVFLEQHPYHDVLRALMRAKGSTPAEWVRDAAGKLLSALESRPDFLNLMFIELVEFNSVHAQELFETMLPKVVAISSRFVEAASELRPIPPPMLARAFLGLFFSYYITERFMPASAPVSFRESSIDHFVDIYLHGILARSDSSP
jgi:AcrR family transcriptional regulator